MRSRPPPSRRCSGSRSRAVAACRPTARATQPTPCATPIQSAIMPRRAAPAAWRRPRRAAARSGTPVARRGAPPGSRASPAARFAGVARSCPLRGRCASGWRARPAAGAGRAAAAAGLEVRPAMGHTVAVGSDISSDRRAGVPALSTAQADPDVGDRDQHTHQHLQQVRVPLRVEHTFDVLVDEARPDAGLAGPPPGPVLGQRQRAGRAGSVTTARPQAAAAQVRPQRPGPPPGRGTRPAPHRPRKQKCRTQHRGPPAPHASC